MKGEETRGGSDLHFHYDREERLAGTNLGKDPGPKGLFRRNRSLAIILLDIIVIVIMFIVFLFVFTPGRSWTRIGDYRIDLKAFQFEDEIYASLIVRRVRARRELPSGSESLIQVRFPETAELLDVLPLEENEEITISVVLTADQVVASGPLEVEIQMLGETTALRTTPEQ
jgi:hypothetical protein